MELNIIKGIGPKMINKLNALNIFSVDDLLNYYPYGYNFFYLEKNLNSSKDNITIEGVIVSEPKVFFIRRNLNRMTFRVIIDNLVVGVSIFNRAFMKRNLHINQMITLHGSYNKDKNMFTASNLMISKIKDNIIEPKYHLTTGITAKDIAKFVNEAFTCSSEIKEIIPNYICQKYDFISRKTALHFIHHPQSIQEIKKAKIKLIYEELYDFMFKINLLKYENHQNTDSLKRNVSKSKLEAFIKGLPFSLTEDQNKAISDIYSDLVGDKRMNRLLLGDVGSGKTIVSVAGLYVNYLAGYQGAMMAPTEILAKQHYETLNKLLLPYNIRVSYLVGSMTSKEKKLVLDQIKNGDIDIIVGTHSLISDKIVFKNLGLAVADEQHRFGVNQRGSLINKGIKCDLLYLSATPIPRTYALTIYGDMDTSLIKSKISGRKEIITKVVKESNIKGVLLNILEEIKKGHQIYVVAPLIEGNDDSNTNDVLKLKEKFDIAYNHKIPIEILHGKMKKDEKEKVMKSFQNNEIKILISTTVIEVGVDVKNSTVMVIFNAERFGLATLHQLRGRVGRNDVQSYCYLICNSEKERLKVLEESNDGFYISEKDFEMRGQGDLFGIKQSGDMSFKIADLKTDYKILLQAKEDSYEFIKNNIKNQFQNYPRYETIYKQMTIY